MRSGLLPLLQIIIILVLGEATFQAGVASLWPASPASAVMVRDLTPTGGERLPARPTRIGAEVIGERDLRRVTLRVNDQELPVTVDPLNPRRWRVSATLAGGASGEQRVVLAARDVHGRQQLQSWRFMVDPTLSVPLFSDLQPPDNGFAPSGGAMIGATIQSDAPISQATLQISGIAYPLRLEPAAGERVVALARVDLKPGVYQAALTAIDRQEDRAVKRWTFTVPDPRELLAFEQTGKTIGGGFRRFWQERGGLPVFGLPISDEMPEGGRTVQYFERARFEYQPSNDGLLSEVQLGLIGSELRRPEPPRPDPATPEARFFPETGQAIRGPIRRFWEERGSLALYGLPISGEFREGGVTVQYFERARLELHPGRGDEVVLGQVGRELYERRYGAAARPAP